MTPHPRFRPSGRHAPAPQRGIVLIVAMIMLVVISLLAAMSVRNATSTERVSGNVRFTELASQAAEIALRVCEQAIVTGPLPAGLVIQDYTSPPLYTQTATVWDATTKHGAIYTLDLTDVNISPTVETFKRPPECVVERMRVASANNMAASTTRSFVITARGFGPDVRTDAAGRPEGTEIFLQSILELD